MGTFLFWFDRKLDVPRRDVHTDSWFYRFLKAWPAGFFTLLGLPAALAERYAFDSVELKKTGWRIDGVLRPKHEADPFYLIEIQAYGLATFWNEVSSPTKPGHTKTY